MKNIYVGNLDFSTTDQDVRALFEPFGQVDNVNLIRDQFSGQPRGFGFVEMANDEEADKAIQQLNGQHVGNRNITVNEARPKAERSRAGAGGGFGRKGGGGGGGGFGRSGGGGGGRGRY
jgi:cold-inducible RNA-binding protein